MEKIGKLQMATARNSGGHCVCSGDVSMRHCVHRSRDEADLLDNEVTGVETTPHWMSPPAAMASMKAFVTDSSLGPKL